LKITALTLGSTGVSRFDLLPELSKLPDHLPGAQLQRSFAYRCAAFFVTNSLVQDQPDQLALSMGNGCDGLIVSQAGNGAVIQDLEEASFRPRGGIRGLIE
jgi:hypothetical protein